MFEDLTDEQVQAMIKEQEAERIGKQMKKNKHDYVHTYEHQLSPEQIERQKKYHKVNPTTARVAAAQEAKKQRHDELWKLLSNQG